MTTYNDVPQPPIRIPNLPMGAIVDKDGNPTDDELTFRQALLSLLQKIAGGEGLVMPAQDEDNIDVIQDNRVPNPVTGSTTVDFSYSCEFGTLIYDTTNNSIRVAVDDGAGAPLFKTVTIT